jgi:hypothetical protein
VFTVTSPFSAKIKKWKTSLRNLALEHLLSHYPYGKFAPGPAALFGYQFVSLDGEN